MSSHALAGQVGTSWYPFSRNPNGNSIAAPARHAIAVTPSGEPVRVVIAPIVAYTLQHAAPPTIRRSLSRRCDESSVLLCALTTTTTAPSVATTTPASLLRVRRSPSTV